MAWTNCKSTIRRHARRVAFASAFACLGATQVAAQDAGKFERESSHGIEDFAIRKEADRWEFTYQVLNMADALLTIDCLNRNVCHEANPLWGRNPSAAKLILGKAAGGVLHYGLYRFVADGDPKMALWLARLSVIGQGGLVVANLRFTF